MNSTKKSQVTPKQLQVLKIIAAFEARQCYSATIAEIALELGVSRTTVFEHIGALREKKMLAGSKGKARSSTITARGQKLLESLHEPDLPKLPDGIALLGRVSAGFGIESYENRDRLTLKDLFGNSDEIFSLEVSGNSMLDAGINSGDYIICKRSSIANNGQMVIAVIDEQEVTVKYFYQEPEGVRLQPANQNIQPMFTRNCRIEAIVIGHLRQI